MSTLPPLTRGFATRCTCGQLIGVAPPPDLRLVPAEPTDAEVIAALNAQTKELGLLHAPAVLSDGRAQMDAMRAALIAARNAG